MYKSRHVSLWQREEDGSYKAEIDGFALHVEWKPEKDGQRGYVWHATGPAEEKLESDHLVEEIEEAMGDAEDALKKHLHPETI
ncbi:MAG: hypothetical protein U0414_18505 [Polyangiaceae bacterium]